MLLPEKWSCRFPREGGRVKSRGVLRRLAITVPLLALAACSGQSGSDGELTLRDEVGGQEVRLDLPKQGNPQALAIWFHGQNADEDARMNEDWLNGLRQRGWAVASGELGGGTSWGSPDSVEAAADLVEWAEARADVPTRLLVAGSMGAAVSLNALASGAIEADCWYGIMPVVDLEAVDEVPDSAEQLQDTYGDTIPAGSNPVDNLEALPQSTKYRVLASPGDTWVPKVDNADVLVAALRQAGADVDAVATAGQHGDPSHFDAQGLVDFANGCS